VELAGHPANAEPTIPLAAFVGSYADSLYGEMAVTMTDGHLELARGALRAPLVYWNANNFRWLVPITEVTGPQFIKFEITPDNTVTGMYFGLAGDVMLLGKKGNGRRDRSRGGP
jgi:hypothetical protein